MRIDELIERVRGLTGPDRETDAEIWRFTDPDDALAKAWPVKGMMYAGHVHTKAEKAAHIKRMIEFYAAPVTASLDAAVALVERVLPGWVWSLRKRSDCCLADLDTEDTDNYGDGGKYQASHGTSAAIALILALLSALKAKEARDGTE